MYQLWNFDIELYSTLKTIASFPGYTGGDKSGLISTVAHV